MRSLLLIVVAWGVVSVAALAQEESSPVAEAKPLKSYVVQFTEIRLKPADDPKFSAANIVEAFEQSKDDGAVEVVETVRLSALDGHECMVQFGKNVAVTVGTANVANAPNFPGGRIGSRQVQYRQVGTMVRITAVSQAEKVLLKLTYEVSRNGRDVREDGAPDLVTIQVNTSLLLEPGKPTFVGGTTADPSTYLLVSIGE